MSNQPRRLSSCPAERLAQCRGDALATSPVPEIIGRVMGAGYDSLNRTVMLEIGNGDFPFSRKIETGTELVDFAHYTRLQTEVSALQQRLNTADQRASDLTWLAKAAYMEGWGMGWITRHTDANNEKRVTPWAPPREVMEREWLTSEGRAALDQPAPAEDVRAVVEEPVGLRAFANDMISAAYEGGSFDGGDIQNIAVKHGLLRIEQRVEACGEHCACSEYGFPAECYRRADILKAPQ
ncbi:hypothetical protein [Pseudomonas petrae]|uniref:Uncharacterized protein n=1 Tax=Pseudomonas petrae TaxID=2912190 RepID=A0ABS9IC66_9PSED|nr:hypothetical protein [Pseudomonas petrae]MCF7545315.1 hypothetical protein [Pseudomonas petrae]